MERLRMKLEFGEEALKRIVLDFYFKNEDVDQEKFEGYWYINKEGYNNFVVEEVNDRTANTRSSVQYTDVQAEGA